MSAVLQLEAVNVFYGASQILFDLSLQAQEGRTLALLGRNGAGKSTTFKAIAGIAGTARGSIVFRGQTLTGRAVHRIARLGIGYVPEDRQVFAEHSVLDNLLIGTKLGAAGQGAWTLPRIWEIFPKLAELRDRMAGRLSGGEQQMLTIARTLMGNPDVLLLDEPSEGLAPIVVQSIHTLLRRLAGDGMTILLAEQNMHFCLGLADDVAVIDKGQIVYRDTIEQLRGNDAVKRRYLAM